MSASRSRSVLGLLAIAALLLSLSVVVSAFASGPGKSRRATATASARCSLTQIQVRPVRVFKRVGGGANYRVQGFVYIPHPGNVSGCTLKVCEAEELGAGNWVPSWCTGNIISRSEHTYLSSAPYVTCRSYGGTGYFRSYARFEGSGASALGVETRLCRGGKPVY
jgi:hypothetical protein